MSPHRKKSHEKTAILSWLLFCWNEIDQIIFKSVFGSKTKTTWCGWQGKRSEWKMEVGDYSDSPLWELSSMCSPLLLLGRGPSPPSLPSCFASSHPGKWQHFRSASLSSQKGTGEKNLANPICPSLLVLCSTEDRATSVIKLQTLL